MKCYILLCVFAVASCQELRNANCNSSCIDVLIQECKEMARYEVCYKHKDINTESLKLEDLICKLNCLFRALEKRIKEVCDCDDISKNEALVLGGFLYCNMHGLFCDKAANCCLDELINFICKACRVMYVISRNWRDLTPEETKCVEQAILSHRNDECVCYTNCQELLEKINEILKATEKFLNTLAEKCRAEPEKLHWAIIAVHCGIWMVFFVLKNFSATNMGTAFFFLVMKAVCGDLEFFNCDCGSA